MSTLPWVLVIVLGATLVVQGVVLRSAYRREVAAQETRHLQFQQAMTGKLDKTRRQIGQLQNDLVAARRQLTELVKTNAAGVRAGLPARQVLERELDATTATRHALPVDGFADTEPASLVTQHGSLLLQ